MRTIGWVLFRWDEDIQNWKPFSRTGGHAFWYSKIAVEQELCVLENLYPAPDKFAVYPVRG